MTLEPNVSPDSAEAPFFSICVPQHNRTAFLIKACQALARQRFRDFEICISDDVSTDGREGELTAYLEGSGLRYRYARQQRNLRYDGNIRAAIALAKGRYCLLHGNDDALADELVLETLHRELTLHDLPEVAITNFAEVNCHPLENTATTRIATADLIRFIKACGHEPLIFALS